ncbi:MAG: hypothetical protein GF401_03840, partial [Chitinivibrionales bacterium]|nr:hypothetical protein [Chitinivibrionales bacterium]
MKRLTFSTCMIALSVFAMPGFAQNWVRTFDGPKDNDNGSRRNAIIKQEFLMTKAAINTPYAHPSMIDETKEGTLIIMFNAGQSEGEG